MRVMLRVVAVVTLALPAVAIAGPGHAPILGGTPVDPGDFPTLVVVEIEIPGQGIAICTGTQIHPEWILTAAHCIDAEELDVSTQEQATALIDVRFDAINAFDAGMLAQVVATVPKTEFDRGRLGDDDIGLVRIAPVDRMVQRVNASAAAAPVGVDVTFVGYGQTTAGTSGRAFVLPGRSSTTCQQYGESDELLLCFDQTDGMGQCFGDSGGPTFAMIDGVATQVGVTSFGDQSCQFFGAETRVDAEYAWLAQVIGAIELRCVHDGVCAFGCPGALRDRDCATCANDADCGADQICDFAGSCLPAPYTTGGLGNACANDGECLTGSCLDAGEGGQCTSDCTGDDQCPAEFECISAGGDRNVCWPGSPGGGGGGCSTGGGASGGLAFALLALLSGRRRRVR
jgi:uncharacterized protein (TIGR03382 family)